MSTPSPISNPSDVAPEATRAPAWARRLRAATNWLSHDALGGPRPWMLATVINLQKAGTVVFVAALMAYYRNGSTAAFVYLALHGGYGLVWLMKEAAFPDPSWQVRVTIAGGLLAFFGVLFWYWVIAWLLISRAAPPSYPLADGAWFALCIGLCLLGSVIMIAADAQKYFTLKLRRGLITDGMFRYIRHPNYLGEMLIYLSFALMAWHWLAFLILAVVWSVLFSVNMVMKEARMARHPEWADYQRRTWWLVPGLF